jgi:hypothetical protein
MSPANAKDLARCSSRGYGSLKWPVLSTCNGRWRPIGLRQPLSGRRRQLWGEILALCEAFARGLAQPHGVGHPTNEETDGSNDA